MALHRKSGVKNPPIEQPHYARDLPLGPGAARTELAGNLRVSVVDPVADAIAAHTHIRGGDIAGDNAIKDQLRPMSSKQMVPTTFGCRPEDTSRSMPPAKVPGSTS